MDRTARHAHWQAQVVGLLTALAAACATVQQPPGGPYDVSPPVLLAIVPESGSVVTGFEGDVEFQFDEVIDERSGGGIERLVTVSPRHDQVRVGWRRTRVTVKPRGGWLAGETYTVQLRAGIADLRQNRDSSAQVIVFSTGTTMPATEVTGDVIDWAAGRLATAALIELIRVGDSVTYMGKTDSTGTFTLEHVPPGQYRLIATLDQNNNSRREGREAFDSALVSLDSVARFDLWTFVHDSTGPTMRTATIVDSLAIAAEFTQELAFNIQDHFVRVLELPDSTPVEVVSLRWRPAFDSLRTAQRDSLAAVMDSVAQVRQDSIAAAIRDSLGTDSLAVDTLAANTVTTDTTRTDSLAAVEEIAEPDSTPPEEAAQNARRDALLAQRPPIYNTFIVVLGTMLVPGQEYLIEAQVANLLGHAETSTRTLLVPMPADSTTPRDST